MESLDTSHVEDSPTIAAPKPKNSKRVSNRRETKRKFMVDDESSSHPKDTTDNDDCVV